MSTANFSPDSIRDDDDSRTMRVKVRNNFNYVTLALNALQDSFKKALKAVSDSIIKPALRGGFNLNDIRYYGTLPNAIASIPTGSAQTIYITMALSITSNTVVPSNLSLVVCKGGSFAISGGVTLTLNGSFDSQGNTLADLFSGAGAYIFGKAVRLIGAGTPEAAVAAPVGSEYLRNNGGTSTTLYIKESGTGNTGWAVFGALTGSGAASRVAYWTSTTALSSAANLLFDGTTLTGPKAVFVSDFTLGASSLVAGAAQAYSGGSGALTFAPTSLTFQTASVFQGANAASEYDITIKASRGTVASPTDVANNDYPLNLVASLYSNGVYLSTAQLAIAVDGTFSVGQRPPTRFEFYTNAAGSPAAVALTLDHSGDAIFAGNLALFGAGSFGGGSKVVFIKNATTDPTTNPTGGGILFCSGGALKYRGSAGTVTTLGAA